MMPLKAAFLVWTASLTRGNPRKCGIIPINWCSTCKKNEATVYIPCYFIVMFPGPCGMMSLLEFVQHELCLGGWSISSLARKVHTASNRFLEFEDGSHIHSVVHLKGEGWLKIWRSKAFHGQSQKLLLQYFIFMGNCYRFRWLSFHDSLVSTSSLWLRVFSCICPIYLGYAYFPQ